MAKKGCNQFTREFQLCETCRDFGGRYGCPWSGRGPDGEVRFESVPGWTAEKVPLMITSGQMDFTYKITACPRYIPG